MTKSYQATIAAIRTAYGHRLRTADYRNLMNMHSVPEIVSYLKETERYGELLQGLDPAVTHRGYLEMLLKRNLFMQCLHFCKLERLQKTPFFRFFIYDYEIRELTKKLQMLPSGPESYISAMDAWLDPYLEISLDELARAETIEEVIEAVKGTPYAAAMKQLRAQPDSEPGYTDYEIALRACYLKRIQQEAPRTLKGNDLAALQSLVGEQIDLVNLINAYRLKHVFHADGATVRRMMLPVHGKLPPRVCTALYDARDLSAFLDIVRTTRYGKQLPEQPELSSLEHTFQLLRHRNAQNALHFSGHAAVSMYAVYVLCETEVRNLITLIEGIRYEKPVSYLQSLLITEG